MEWDESLRYNYSLNKDSIVFDLGGFEGDWAFNIYMKYLSKVLVFEPVKEFYEIIQRRFQHTGGIRVYNYGLGSQDETVNIGVTGSSTSILNTAAANVQAIQIKDLLPVLSEFAKVDLMKINIEGAEYDLLDYIIKMGAQTKFVNIQIQFHMNVPDYENRRQAIREALSKTHHLTYDFAYTHENWELN